MILQASQMNWNIKDAAPDDIVDIVKHPNSLISEIVFSISGWLTLSHDYACMSARFYEIISFTKHRRISGENAKGWRKPCVLWYILVDCDTQPWEHFSVRYANIVTVQHVSYLILFVWVVGTSLASMRLWNDKIFLVVIALVVGICLCCRCLFIRKFFASFDFKFRPRERSSMHVKVLTCSTFQKDWKDSSQRFSV